MGTLRHVLQIPVKLLPGFLFKNKSSNHQDRAKPGETCLGVCVGGGGWTPRMENSGTCSPPSQQKAHSCVKNCFPFLKKNPAFQGFCSKCQGFKIYDREGKVIHLGLPFLEAAVQQHWGGHLFIHWQHWESLGTTFHYLLPLPEL